MKEAANVVDMLLENEIVRVCMYCDQTNPVRVGPGQSKSHGVCRKHIPQYAKDMAGGNPEMEAKLRASLEAKPESGFAPTTESVDASVAQKFAQDTGLSLHPEITYGSMSASSLGSLSPQEQDMMRSLASWEFTDRRPGPSSGITFYVPVNASYEEMTQRWEQKKKDFGL